jgi:hypothetical protein
LGASGEGAGIRRRVGERKKDEAESRKQKAES